MSQNKSYRKNTRHKPFKQNIENRHKYLDNLPKKLLLVDSVENFLNRGGIIKKGPYKKPSNKLITFNGKSKFVDYMRKK